MVAEDESAFVASFHAGDRKVLERVYRDCFKAVWMATSRILRDVDAETVTHEVFLRVLSDAKVRESFTGGSICSWLAQIGTRAAIDRYRRLRRETNAIDDAPEVDPRRVDDEVEAKMLVERFRKERLPPKWESVFEARFLRQLPQRTAAKELGMQRSTLAYQEQQ